MNIQQPAQLPLPPDSKWKVAIVADEEVRQARARSRGHAGVEGREARQLKQFEKAALATHVVENNGTPEELQERLAELVSGLEA